MVVTWYDQIKSLLGNSEVKNAKDILEWLDLITSYAAGGASTLGFIKFLDWRRGREIEDVDGQSNTTKNGKVSVKVKGENNPITINQHTWNLSQNPNALEGVRGALSPVGRDGFNAMEISGIDGNKGRILEADAENIIRSCNAGLIETLNLKPDIKEFTTWLTVYSPVFNDKAKHWRFRLGKDIIDADISLTTIAAGAIKRGGTMIDDSYQVSLQYVVEKTSKGKLMKPKYNILEVIRFVPANPEFQKGFDFDDNEKNPSDNT